MDQALSRRIALAVAAAMIFPAAQASAADPFTLHCAIVAKDQTGKPFKYEELYFVDLAAGKFCTARCDVVFNIESVNGQAITLHQSSDDVEPELIMPNWEDRVTIDLARGVLTGRHRLSAAYLSRSELTGRCTRLARLPVPIALALRAAPKTDVVTFTDPAR